MLRLITISFLLVLSKCCDTSHSFDHSSCVFYINYLDDSCAAFNFMDCTWQVCDAWVYINHSLTCIHYATQTSTDWNSCTQTCCSSGSAYSETSDSLNQCQNTITSRFNTTVIIVCSIVGGFVLIFVIAFLWCRFRQGCQDCCTNFREGLSNCVRCRCFFPNIQVNEPNLENRQQSNISLAGMNIWREADNSKPLPNSNFCSVCLDGGCFFELECHHVFHRQCIIACLNKKGQCILCRSTALQTANVYCQRCFQYYYVAPLNRFMIVETNAEQICDNCKRQNMNA